MAQAGSAASVKMFRKRYDKYLENYQGYVELAERLYKRGTTARFHPGSKNASGSIDSVG